MSEKNMNQAVYQTGERPYQSLTTSLDPDVLDTHMSGFVNLRCDFLMKLNSKALLRIHSCRMLFPRGVEYNDKLTNWAMKWISTLMHYHMWVTYVCFASFDFPYDDQTQD